MTAQRNSAKYARQPAEVAVLQRASPPELEGSSTTINGHLVPRLHAIVGQNICVGSWVARHADSLVFGVILANRWCTRVRNLIFRRHILMRNRRIVVYLMVLGVENTVAAHVASVRAVRVACCLRYIVCFSFTYL